MNNILNPASNFSWSEWNNINKLKNTHWPNPIQLQVNCVDPINWLTNLMFLLVHRVGLLVTNDPWGLIRMRRSINYDVGSCVRGRGGYSKCNRENHRGHQRHFVVVTKKSRIIFDTVPDNNYTFVTHLGCFSMRVEKGKGNCY